MKKTLLIVNLGTPDKPNYFSVFKYLRQFLMDGRVINVNPVIRFFLVNLCNELHLAMHHLGMVLQVFLKLEDENYREEDQNVLFQNYNLGLM